MDPENTKQAMIDSMIAQVKEGAALSFQSEETSTEDLRKLKSLFDPESKQILKKWLQQGNLKAIEGIQKMTGSSNIKLEKSYGKHINENRFEEILKSILKQDDLIDVILPISPFSGQVHLLLTLENAHKIVDKLMYQANIEPKNEIEVEPLLEVTNIIGSAYTNSLTQISEVSVEPGVPTLYDNKAEIVAIIEKKMQADKIRLLKVENHFRWEGENITGILLILIPKIEF